MTSGSSQPIQRGTKWPSGNRQKNTNNVVLPAAVRAWTGNSKPGNCSTMAGGGGPLRVELNAGPPRVMAVKIPIQSVDLRQKISAPTSVHTMKTTVVNATE